MENRKVPAEIELSSSRDTDSKDETSVSNGGPSEFSDTGSDYSFSWDDCGRNRNSVMLILLYRMDFLILYLLGLSRVIVLFVRVEIKAKRRMELLCLLGFLSLFVVGMYNFRNNQNAGDYEDSSHIEATSSSSASSVDRVERRKVDGKGAEESLVCTECKRKRCGIEKRGYDVSEMEKLSIAELIDSLKTEFRVEYYEKVKQILISRESKLKYQKEVEHLKLEVGNKQVEDLKKHKVAEEVVKEKSLSLFAKVT